MLACAKITYAIHCFGSVVLYSSPQIVYFYPKLYASLILLQIGTLLSWYLYDRKCILAIFENHFDPNYPIITVKKSTVLVSINNTITMYFTKKYENDTNAKDFILKYNSYSNVFIFLLATIYDF